MSGRQADRDVANAMNATMMKTRKTEEIGRKPKRRRRRQTTPLWRSLRTTTRFVGFCSGC